MLKIILPIYAILFYGVAFFWRSYQTWRKTGINPYRLTATEDVHGFTGKAYRLISLASAVVLTIFVFWDGLYAYLTPIAWLEIFWLDVLGVVLLFASLTWILVAQMQMGNAWRIGIDEENPTDLVTGGIFQLSRNPIFLGVRLNFLGLFLILPNAITLTIWLLGDVMLQIQVLLEEDFLLGAHGDAYQRYAQQVRRWI